MQQIDIRLLEEIAVDLRIVQEWGAAAIGTSFRHAALCSTQYLRAYLTPALQKQLVQAARSGVEREDLYPPLMLELYLTFEDWRRAWLLISMMGVEDDLQPKRIKEESTCAD